MDYNGMTEEEYLDSLLKQASDDIPKENTAETEADEAVFDFEDIFGALAEAETASAESVSEEISENEQITEDFITVEEDFAEEESVSEQVEVAEELTEDTEDRDFFEDFFSQMENEMENVSLEEEAVSEEENVPDNIPTFEDMPLFEEESVLEDVTSLFETEASLAEENAELGLREDEEEQVQLEETMQPEEQVQSEETVDFTDFHRSLDSIIGELEKDREDSENEEFDIFSQIDNTELSDEELSQDVDDMSLLEAVGMLLDEEEKANEKQQDFDGLFDFDDEIPEKNIDEPEIKVKEEKPKKEFFKKFKNFLVEQGEDTEEDIAAEEAAAIAKEEKEKKAAEDREKKAEEKAAKKEKAEQDKAAKKAEKEGKALERQMKKEQKKAEQEASGEPKYNVTVIKLALLFTIVAASGILLWAISSFNYRRISKKEAMIYFTADQYELAYEKIAGLEPRKSDDVFFEQVRTVMYVQKQYDSYLNYYNISMKEEALDALLKGIDKYDKYYETADDLGILDDMDNVLEKIYTALEESYNLSREMAYVIANIEDSADYSVELRKVINSIKE